MKPEGCPSCRVTLVWMGVKAPHWLGFCEGCGAFWMHGPEGLRDATEACYGLFAPRLEPDMPLSMFRADDLRGRTMRAFAAQRMRADYRDDAP